MRTASEVVLAAAENVHVSNIREPQHPPPPRQPVHIPEETFGLVFILPILQLWSALGLVQVEVAWCPAFLGWMLTIPTSAALF